MERVKRYRVRGIPGHVERVSFDGRIVDYWSPSEKTSHLLVAHDGQNVFDRRTATRFATWKMAQRAISVSKKLGIAPPLIIAVFNSRTRHHPWGRVIDLAPQDPFQNGVPPVSGIVTDVKAEDLKGNRYLDQITEQIIPAITQKHNLDSSQLNTAVIGASMGGLASLYAISKRPDIFTTALALSPHWLAGEDPLVDALIDLLPPPKNHKIWMSHGTRGHDKNYGPFQLRANRKLAELGWIQEKNFIFRHYKRYGHNERSWSRKLRQPLNFWLNSD